MGIPNKRNGKTKRAMGRNKFTRNRKIKIRSRNRKSMNGFFNGIKLHPKQTRIILKTFGEIKKTGLRRAQNIQIVTQEISDKANIPYSIAERIAMRLLLKEQQKLMKR